MAMDEQGLLDAGLIQRMEQYNKRYAFVPEDNMHGVGSHRRYNSD